MACVANDITNVCVFIVRTIEKNEVANETQFIIKKAGFIKTTSLCRITIRTFFIFLIFFFAQVNLDSASIFLSIKLDFSTKSAVTAKSSSPHESQKIFWYHVNFG